MEVTAVALRTPLILAFQVFASFSSASCCYDGSRGAHEIGCELLYRRHGLHFWQLSKALEPYSRGDIPGLQPLYSVLLTVLSIKDC